MPEPMLALGEYRFSIDTAAYQHFERLATYLWPEQLRLGRAPALQYVGKGGETIRLSGLIFPFYKGGRNQLNDMRAEAGKGQPLHLTAGTGEFLGRWCIVEVEERGSEFTFAGVPKQMEFGVTIRRYEESINDTDASLAYAAMLRPKVSPLINLTAPPLAPAPIADLELPDISDMLPAFQQAGLSARQALATLNKITTTLANARQQAAGWKASIAQIGLTVDQVERGLLTDPAGTLRTILTTANGLGPGRLPVLSSLVGPDLVADATQLATAMSLAQGTVRILK